MGVVKIDRVWWTMSTLTRQCGASRKERGNVQWMAVQDKNGRKVYNCRGRLAHRWGTLQHGGWHASTACDRHKIGFKYLSCKLWEYNIMMTLIKAATIPEFIRRIDSKQKPHNNQPLRGGNFGISWEVVGGRCWRSRFSLPERFLWILKFFRLRRFF